MALTVSRETQRLNLPLDLPGVEEGDWVEILTAQSSGMRRRITRRSMTVSAQSGNTTPDIDFDAFGYRQALLEEIVVDWSDPSPLSPEGLESMAPAVQDWIAEQFDAMAAGRSEEEKKLSVIGSSASPQPARANSRTSSRI